LRGSSDPRTDGYEDIADSEIGVNFVRVINKADQRHIGAVGFDGI
jgi:hypothetical protein